MSCQAGWAPTTIARSHAHVRAHTATRTHCRFDTHTHMHTAGYINPEVWSEGPGAWRNSGRVRRLFNILFVSLMRQFEDVCCCCVTAPVRRIWDVQHNDRACFDCILAVSVSTIFIFPVHAAIHLRIGNSKRVEFWVEMLWIASFLDYVSLFFRLETEKLLIRSKEWNPPFLCCKRLWVAVFSRDVLVGGLAWVSLHSGQANAG